MSGADTCREVLTLGGRSGRGRRMNAVPTSTMLDQLGQVLVLPLGQRLERLEQRAPEGSQRVPGFVGSWPCDPVALDEGVVVALQEGGVWRAAVRWGDVGDDSTVVQAQASLQGTGVRLALWGAAMDGELLERCARTRLGDVAGFLDGVFELLSECGGEAGHGVSVS